MYALQGDPKTVNVRDDRENVQVIEDVFEVSRTISHDTLEFKEDEV